MAAWYSPRSNPSVFVTAWVHWAIREGGRWNKHYEIHGGGWGAGCNIKRKHWRVQCHSQELCLNVERHIPVQACNPRPNYTHDKALSSKSRTRLPPKCQAIWSWGLAEVKDPGKWTFEFKTGWSCLELIHWKFGANCLFWLNRACSFNFVGQYTAKLLRCKFLQHLSKF